MATWRGEMNMGGNTSAGDKWHSIARVPLLRAEAIEFAQKSLGDLIVFGMIVQVKRGGITQKQHPDRSRFAGIPPLMLSLNDSRLCGLVSLDGESDTLRGVWRSGRTELIATLRDIKEAEVNAASEDSRVVACITEVPRGMLCCEDEAWRFLPAFINKAWCDAQTAAEKVKEGWLFEGHLEWRDPKRIE